ncbi:MAG TPA: CHRD domain-containing protein [Burkholderiaceae bacterium]
MALLRLTVIRAALFAACALCAAGALAEDLQLTGAQEVPPNDSKAVGSGSIKIDPDGNVSGSVSTPTIQGKAAHIHVGAPGKAGPPIITLNGGDPGVWSVPQGAKLNAEQIAAWKAGDLYVNVHTAEHPGGEVRAQIKAP